MPMPTRLSSPSFSDSDRENDTKTKKTTSFVSYPKILKNEKANSREIELLTGKGDEMEIVAIRDEGFG